MTVQLVVLGTRRPDSDDDYSAYVGVAGKLLADAGGTMSGRYQQISHLIGDSGPQQIVVMDFPDEQSVTEVFASPEYQAVAPRRDKAFEQLSVIVAAAE